MGLAAIGAMTQFAIFAAGAAVALQLEPFKDRLFEYPKILEERDGGAYVRVEYMEQRDLDNRDEISQFKVRQIFVSLATKKVEQDLVLSVGDLTIPYIAVGKTDGAKIVIIYLHGKNVTRVQGANDWMFGGNFNRIKNLMMRGEGAYLSPDFSDFGARGAAEIKALMLDVARRSPGAPIFVACGSMGGQLCWRIAGDPQTAALLGGLIMMGTATDPDFAKSAAWKRRVPVYLGHGTKDTVYAWQDTEAFFHKLRAMTPDYPVRLVLFETGVHGTPIRMTDWRLILNWMLANSPPA